MTVRIAMWSGPRNISTAMMRAFENRPDTEVIDEPFYASFLIRSGADHPMRQEVLAAQETDPVAVARAISGDAPRGAAIFYQKHMTHHMLAGFDLGWMAKCRNAFLIRRPEAVLASYSQKRGEATLDDIGVVRQREIFDREADRLGHAPPVVEGADVLADPRGTLGRLCAALGIPFSDRMLAWPAGPRASDGVWAPYWYDSVWRSTGFRTTSAPDDPLPPELEPLAEQCTPFYQRLSAHRLKFSPAS